MTSYFKDPTLAELLSDPLTRAVMRADGVSTRELEHLLRHVAARRADSSVQIAPTLRSRLQCCGAQ